MLFELSTVSIILFLLIMAGFITLWAASLLESKRANKPIRLADNDTECISLKREPWDSEAHQGIVNADADGYYTDKHGRRVHTSDQFYREGTYVPPTYMNRHQRRAASKVNRRKVKTVATGAAIILLTLTMSLAGSAVAWHYGGGQMYAEPCHSLLWCH